MALIPAGSAVRSPGVRRAMAGIAVAVLAADQASKALVLALRPAAGRAYGTGWISVRLVLNTGASGGLASGHPVLVTLAALAVTGVACALALRARGRVTALFLSAVLGGAAGNLADRVFRAPGFGRGAVVDWIRVGGGGGSFNVADMAIQLGVLGAVASLLLYRESAGAARKARSPERGKA